jgi:tetratricopeptide (TPR) repeat protein
LLASDQEIISLFDRIDGTQNLGQAIGTGFNSAPTLAAIWILTQGQFVNFRDTPLDLDADPDEELFTTEIEIEVATTPSPDSAQSSPAADPSHATEESAVNSGGVTKMAMEMRAEVLELLDGLAKRSFYELLGIGEHAGDAEIRKAYFSRAKRFHPDALTHLGLTDIKQAAAQVFARIAEANNVLRNPEKRANYDARGDAEEIMVDTRALAQAETAFRKGEILVRMGDFRGALEYLEPAVELWPEECDYQSALGWAIFRQPKSDPEKALVHLEKAVELDDTDAPTLFRLGTVLRATGEGERSASLLTEARLIDPDVG